MGSGSLRAGAITIAELVNPLMGSVQRTIVDKTGLTQHYDVDLSYSMEVRDFPGGAAPSRSWSSIASNIRCRTSAKP